MLLRRKVRFPAPAWKEDISVFVGRICIHVEMRHFEKPSESLNNGIARFPVTGNRLANVLQRIPVASDTAKVVGAGKGIGNSAIPGQSTGIAHRPFIAFCRPRLVVYMIEKKQKWFGSLGHRSFVRKSRKSGYRGFIFPSIESRKPFDKQAPMGERRFSGNAAHEFHGVIESGLADAFQRTMNKCLLGVGIFG